LDRSDYVHMLLDLSLAFAKRGVRGELVLLFNF
jgi:hypothetical protein